MPRGFLRLRRRGLATRLRGQARSWRAPPRRLCGCWLGEMLLQDRDDIEPDAARLSKVDADADLLAALGGECNRAPV